MSRQPLAAFAVVVAISLTTALALGGCDADLVTTCGAGASTGGATVPPVTSVEMGATSGTFDFRYETRNAHDQIEVFYEGKSLFNSGCVGESREMALNFGPGESTSVDVVVTPNCAGTPMTSWLFEVGCPIERPLPSVPSVQVTAPTPSAEDDR